MEKSLFIVLAVCIMSSGVSGISESMSCSTVNGKTICNKETNAGNAAMSSSSASIGSQGSFQNTYAGAGDPGVNWQSSGQKVSTGNGGLSASNDYFDFGDADLKGDNRGSDYPVDKECSYTSSSSSSPIIDSYAGPTPVVGGFGFASAGNFFSPGIPSTFVSGIISIPQGGPSGGGMSFSSSSSGSAPNFGGNGAPMTSTGFVTAGNAMPPGFPFNFVPGFGYPPQGPPPSSGAGNAGGSFAGAGNTGGSFAGAGNAGGFTGAGAFAGAGSFGPGNFGPGNFGPGNFDPMAFVFGRR